MTKTQQIPLSRGLFATVDESDFAWLSQWKWSALKTGKLGTTFYAVRSEKVDGKSRMILMHRLIAGADKGSVVDHHDRDGLNNTRDNLRLCRQRRNSLNHLGHRDRSMSRFKGVWWHSQMSRWCASFRGHYLGMFITEDAAAHAYDVVARLCDPEFALTNFDALGNECPHDEPTVTVAPARQQSSKHFGVTFNRRTGKWRVQIKGKQVGAFVTEEEAAAVAAAHIRGQRE
jgi:hypothetical protein